MIVVARIAIRMGHNMSAESAVMSTTGCKPRSRWILLAILSPVALGMWSLIIGWSATEREIVHARACAATCLEQRQAYVEKAEVYTSTGDGQPGSSSTSYRAWLTIDGRLQKIDNERSRLEKGDRPTVELFNGKVVTVNGGMIWNGWPISKTAALIFLFPIALFAALGALTQALALALHARRIRRATDLSTFGAVVVGVFTSLLMTGIGYAVIGTPPWYWVYVAAGGGCTITAFCMFWVIKDSQRL